MKPADRNQNQLEQERIKQIMSDRLGIAIAELRANADLREDLNAEELEISDLLMTLEKELDTQLSPDETKRIRTVGDVLNFFDV